jgi:uncharacterized protein YciI
MSKKQQFLYVLRPARIEMLTAAPTEHEAAILDEHFAYLKDLVEQGALLLAGRTLNADPSTFGIAVLVAGSGDDARRIMENDPAVRGRVMRAELFPFRVALAAKDWTGAV